jgi:hypothetical protein
MDREKRGATPEGGWKHGCEVSQPRAQRVQPRSHTIQHKKYTTRTERGGVEGRLASASWLAPWKRVGLASSCARLGVGGISKGWQRAKSKPKTSQCGYFHFDGGVHRWCVRFWEGEYGDLCAAGGATTPPPHPPTPTHPHPCRRARVRVFFKSTRRTSKGGAKVQKKGGKVVQHPGRQARLFCWCSKLTMKVMASTPSRSADTLPPRRRVSLGGGKG